MQRTMASAQLPVQQHSGACDFFGGTKLAMFLRALWWFSGRRPKNWRSKLRNLTPAHTLQLGAHHFVPPRFGHLHLCDSLKCNAATDSFLSFDES